jgi:hypothetical protein
LAKVARPFLLRGRSLLYHGSRSPAQILRENVLLFAQVDPSSFVLATASRCDLLGYEEAGK